ncbi:hypothetical protein HYH03_007920 [Edaphochlamys debaryana]|uniref:Ankyrin repeat domain-containing protein n=1 Tax=Edaphochlamys debaryana TaxID=47281 RepID=A0A836C014_9CHLO|nr:hypothetical protein HYH03_007920 [Edaphochlamys debaryana]|eukprot:KAG2493993.1 hypothetical protein HYH03_007920 [Edaphochlamys debaryana]
MLQTETLEHQDRVPGLPSTDTSRVLISEIAECIARHLSSNEVACLRFVNREVADLFERFKAVQLEEQLPEWAVKAIFVTRWKRRESYALLMRERRGRVVGIAARCCSDVADLEAVLAAADAPPNQQLVEDAARGGNLRACRWLTDPCRFEGRLDWRPLLSAAAGGGEQSVVDWCLEAGSYEAKESTAYAAESAAREGHESLMEWLLAMAQPYDGSLGRYSGICEAAFRGCSLETAQRMWERTELPDPANDPEGWELREVLSNALVSKRDWQAKAEFLIERGVSLSTSSYREVAELPCSGDVLERFEWLKRAGLRPCCYTLPALAARGNTAALAWLLAEGAAADDESARQRAFETAARSGHVEALRLLTGAGWACSLPGVFEAAAEGGQAGALQWAWDEAAATGATVQCNLEPELFVSAAKSGSPEAMRWLSVHGGRGAKGAWAKAVESGCEAAVDVLTELNCPKPTNGGPYGEAVNQRDWRLLPVLKRAGVSLGPPNRSSLVLQALRKGVPLSVLQWMLEEGCPAPHDWWEAVAAVRGSSGAEVGAWVRATAEAQGPRRSSTWAAEDREDCWGGSWRGPDYWEQRGHDHWY